MIQLKEVSKIYQLGQTDVIGVENINLNIKKGEFTALAGPSGSGKSTLLNLMGCLDTPTNGEILIEDQDTVKLSDKKKVKLRKKKIGFIFQNFNLVPVLSVYENVEYPLLLENINADTRKKMVLEVLDEVGLGHRIDHFPGKLSGGERQRVSIARALVKKPSLVLADEPTANLDSKTGNKIIDLMYKLNQQDNLTFIFSSHDSTILDNAQRIVPIRDGKINDENIKIKNVR
mgnify:CR=1 FL=1